MKEYEIFQWLIKIPQLVKILNQSRDLESGPYLLCLCWDTEKPWGLHDFVFLSNVVFPLSIRNEKKLFHYFLGKEKKDLLVAREEKWDVSNQALLKP